MPLLGNLYGRRGPVDAIKTAVEGEAFAEENLPWRAPFYSPVHREVDVSLIEEATRDVSGKAANSHNH